MTILADNIDYISELNNDLADNLKNINLDDSILNVDVKQLSLEKQLARLMYLTCGRYNLSCVSDDELKNEAMQEAYDDFTSADIASTRFDKHYYDKHFDFHFFAAVKQFRSFVKHSKIEMTSQPCSRRKPTYLIVIGLTGRENIIDFIKEVSPSHVLLIETDISQLHHFLSEHSIQGLRQVCQDDIQASLGISIGCGEVEDIQKEIQQWICSHDELSTEGLLISRNFHKCVKKEALYEFLTTDTWHMDILARMGYQLDEYNMLSNTGKNFATVNHAVINPPLPPEIPFINKPCIITGSGPSLDSSLSELKLLPRESFLLVSGGSSISTLMNSGLTPDIHVQLERSEHQFLLHEKLSNEHDLSNILLIASSTTPHRLQELFSKIIYFFRPALSPLSIYANSSSEILNAEGPDTINAACAAITALNFQNIALIGVDCGSKSKAAIRSKGAFGGYIPRTLNKVEKGAAGKTVFTNHRLQSVRFALSGSFYRRQSSNIVNFSDGLEIPYTEYQDIKHLSNWIHDLIPPVHSEDNSNESISSELFKMSFPLTKERMFVSWELTNPRQKCFEFFRNIESVITSASDIRVLSLGIRNLISISVRRSSKSQQLIPRIVRGTYAKLMPVLINFVNSVEQQDEVQALSICCDFLLKFSDCLESDIYSVIDDIEVEESK